MLPKRVTQVSWVSWTVVRCFTHGSSFPQGVLLLYDIILQKSCTPHHLLLLHKKSYFQHLALASGPPLVHCSKSMFCCRTEGRVFAWDNLSASTSFVFEKLCEVSFNQLFRQRYYQILFHLHGYKPHNSITIPCKQRSEHLEQINDRTCTRYASWAVLFKV